MYQIMKRINLKSIIGSIMIALALQTMSAQPVTKIGYFMDNAPYKHLLNPALAPVRGYISYPALGSIGFDMNSNLGLKNFIFPGLNEGDKPLTFMHEDVTPEQFLSQLSPENYLKLNQRLSILGFGFYSGTTFWTFEMATRINAKVNIPYDLFSFMKNGMSHEAGNVYNIDNLTVSAGMLAETSLGASFRITDDIRVGVKGKVLVGGAKVIAGIDQMTIDMKPDRWEVNTNGLINLYGFDFTTDEEEVVDGFDFSSPNMAGLGFALDIGASWTPIENVTVSAGILDLGTINWNKNFNRVARSQGSATFSGIDGIGLGESEGGEEEEDPLAETFEGLMKIAQFKVVEDEENNFAEKLSPIFNVGVEAGVLDNKISVGLLYTNRMLPNNRVSEITSMINFKPFSGFNFSASYSLLNGVAETFGLGMGLNLGIANIFIACDYIPTIYTPQYIPLTKASTNLQAGFTVALGKMKANK
jgi:hypothetical protein